MRNVGGMLLIAYDGSASARAAIAEAGHLFPGHEAVVLTAWEALLDTLARSGAVGLGGVSGSPNPELDEQVAARALRTATEGATLATAAGLRAEPRAIPSVGSTAATIVQVGEGLNAAAVILGSRGHGRVASLLLGSTSQHVLHHAARPVIIVPAPEGHAVDQRAAA